VARDGLQLSKLRELIVYIAYRMERTHHRGRGRLKLHKLMFYCDFEAYRRLGESITGATYRRFLKGPFLREEHDAVRMLDPQSDFVYKRDWGFRQLPDAKRPPDTAMFSAAERALIDEILDAYREHTADEMRLLSHEHPGYRMVCDGEPIPYDSVFVSTRKPPDAAVEFGRQLIRDGKWRQAT
jgi:hypothetical protein